MDDFDMFPFELTVKQRIKQNTSFESDAHDIYNPVYSSEDENEIRE